jgi:hypothetical protein
LHHRKFGGIRVPILGPLSLRGVEDNVSFPRALLLFLHQFKERIKAEAQRKIVGVQRNIA